MNRHDCHTEKPVPHPWHEEITDLACGYDFRHIDPLCNGCHRNREESPLDQLIALDPTHTPNGITR
jgi:hypothetical protein